MLILCSLSCVCYSKQLKQLLPVILFLWEPQGRRGLKIRPADRGKPSQPAGKWQFFPSQSDISYFANTVIKWNKSDFQVNKPDFSGKQQWSGQQEFNKWYIGGQTKAPGPGPPPSLFKTPQHRKKKEVVLIQPREKGGKASKTSSKVDVDLLLSKTQQQCWKLYYLLLKSG